MQTYLTLVSMASLAGFYAATIILSRVLPAFALGVDDSVAIRRTLATALGVVTVSFPLWRLHWMSLRRLWTERRHDGHEYLLAISSLGVVATAVTAGRLVTRIAMLLLHTQPASTAGWTNLLNALLLFLVSCLLWRHHWRLLRCEATAPQSAPRRRPTASSVPLPDPARQHRQQAA